MAGPLVLALTKCLQKVLVGATEFAGKGFGQNHYRFAPLAAAGWWAALPARRRWCLCEKGLQCATTMEHKTSRKGLVRDIFATQLGMSAKGRERGLGEIKGDVGVWITFAITLANLESSSVSLRYTWSQPR